MSERKIQIAIVDSIRSAIVCACPNYTPAHWWECDLWAVKKSGRWTEYEIKMSVEDFKADAKKAQANWSDDFQDTSKDNKHVLLAARSPRGPSQFYYVVPQDLRLIIEQRNMLPEWAGLIVAKEYRGLHGSELMRYITHVVKVAPTLHKGKATTREIRLAQRRMWFRYWDSIKNIEHLADCHALERARAKTSQGAA